MVKIIKKKKVVSEKQYKNETHRKRSEALERARAIKKEKSMEDDPVESKEIVFKNFRIVRADKHNWMLELKDDNGKYDKNKRKYFLKLESALSFSLEEMIAGKIERIDIKEAIEQIKEFKKEILEIAGNLSL